MSSQTNPYQLQSTQNFGKIREMLRSLTPCQVADVLEKEGWHREWACCAVEHVEYQHNPAGLRDHPHVNQKLRDRFQTQFYIGLALFVIGFGISTVTLRECTQF